MVDMSKSATDGMREQSPHPMAVDGTTRIVLESLRRTRIAADVDVLVLGGGPAGVAASLSAAREGARTLLIERHGMVGGMWTAGLHQWFRSSSAPRAAIICP